MLGNTRIKLNKEYEQYMKNQKFDLEEKEEELNKLENDILNKQVSMETYQLHLKFLLENGVINHNQYNDLFTKAIPYLKQ